MAKKPTMLIAIAVPIALMVAASGGSMYYTSRPEFCNTCHEMNKRYASWQVGAHRDVGCLECHAEPGFPGFVAVKLEGVSRLVRYVTGQQGHQVREELTNVQCLRCHEQLSEVMAQPVGMPHPMPHAAHERLGLKCTACHEQSSHDLPQAKRADMATCRHCHAKPQVAETTCQPCHSGGGCPIFSSPQTARDTTGKSVKAGL